jgi:DNA polymerase III subunit beta
MIITVDRGDLVRAIGAARATVPSRSTIPILGNIKLSACAGRVSVVGTDLERQCTDIADAEITADGAVTIPADVLTSIAKAMPAGRISLAWSADDGRIEIKSGRARYRIATLPATDYPDIAGTDAGTVIRAQTSAMRRIFGDLLFAASDDETRPYMCGVHLLRTSADGPVRATATDGHRLVMVDAAAHPGEQPLPPGGAIIPRQAMADVARLIDGIDGDVEIEISPTRFRLRCGDVVYASKLVDGHFPDVDRVIPADHIADGVVVDKAAIEAALGRVMAVMDARAVAMRISARHGASEMDLFSRRGGEHEASDAIPAEVLGKGIETGICAKYLVEQLAVMRGDRVTLRMDGSAAPIRIVDHGSPNDRHVIMPMKY